MLFLDQNDPDKKQLETLTPAISTIAEACVCMMFGKKCTIPEDWIIGERLNGNFTHNICLGCGNNNYQALAVLGLSDDLVNEFIGDTEPNPILDAFGEMLNTYFGLLNDHIGFSSVFGILTQSIAQYSADVNFYPRAWCCNGYLASPEGHTLYVGFAIKNTTSTQ